jgi:cell division protein FtsA
MVKEVDRNLIVALDIGTSKVAAVVGEITDDDQLSIVGVGCCPSKGMDKGGVNDLQQVMESIQKAVDEAELMADCRISSVYLGISGKHISCQNESGMVAINDVEVIPDDVDSVIHAAKSVPISAERRMLHVLPQEFSVDMQEGIKSPVGMSGVRMEDMAKNIVKCVERCELKADQLIFTALASSYAVLTEDEKELGVCVVDIGGGTIDIAIYTSGALRYSAVLPVAGNQVTNDIAKIFRTPIGYAEEIKVQYACAIRNMASAEENIEVPSVGGRPARSMSRHTLAEVIEPRYQELFEFVLEEIRNSDLESQVAAGIVLTGGTAKMEGAIELAEDIFQMPVRLGEPLAVTGLTDYVNDPSYSTAVGLLLYGKEMKNHSLEESHNVAGVGNMLRRISSWFKGEF